MKKRLVLVWLVAAVTLGSGLVNLYSVMGPALPERRAYLREIFPLEFLQLSRFLTLLIGFALVISSLNIYKRKRRAFQMVFALASLSVIFHMSKGLDYEEASASVVLLVLLWVARRNFTVKSSVPDLRWGVARLAVAFLLALGYGVIGFWVLEPREFGINFTMADALRRTLRFLSLAGDPQIIPHTRHARWFVDSLFLMTGTSMAYALFAVFRPVLYRFATLPHEREKAAEIVKQHGRSTQDFFKYWPDKSLFFAESGDAFLAYRVGGNFAIVLADPVGPEEKIGPLVQEFREFCRDNDWGHGFYQTLPDFSPIYLELGYHKLKIGDDAIVDLTAFSLQGKGMKKLRYYVNLFEKMGVVTRSFEPPHPPDLVAQAKEVSDDWLQIPGRRERSFTLGHFDPAYLQTTPLFAAFTPEGRMLGFVNLIPSFCPGEATIDLMRHRNDAPNGTMDYVLLQLFLHEQERGFRRFNLGMAPMAGFQEHEGAKREERAVHFFFQQLNFVFSFSGLRQYKAKFASHWEPRYVVYENVLDLPRLVMALRNVSELKG